MNPYTWEIKDALVVDTNVDGLSELLANCGSPTAKVVKSYEELGARIGHSIEKWGTLIPDVRQDLYRMFEANRPLHLYYNEFLRKHWSASVAQYKGKQHGVKLYTYMRSKATKWLGSYSVGETSLYEYLKEKTNPEIHHMLYKAKFPNLAVQPTNLVLVGSNEKKKQCGPGQHELMHIVASGKHSDKLKVLLPAFVEAYLDWMEATVPADLIVLSRT